MQTPTTKLGLISLPILVSLGLAACAGDNTLATSKNQDLVASVNESQPNRETTDAKVMPDVTAQVVDTTPQQTPDIVADSNDDKTKMGPDIHPKPEQDVIFFAFNQSSPSTKEIALLKSHAEYLAEHPDVHIAINGHTDSHGPKVYNNYLSRKRAEQVAAVLIANGVNPQQIRTQGFADDQPDLMAQSDQQQRRVELVYPANVVATLN